MTCLLDGEVYAALKVFVVAFAVIDDLIAIIMIALFYSENIALHYLISSIAVFVGLLCLNIIFRVDSLLIYLLGGLLMWIFMLKSGVHATAAGVMLAFAIPFWSRNDQEPSLSHQLENYLHKPVAFLVLPLFALANTGIVFDSNSAMKLTEPNSLGVILGLLIGKPLGVALASAVAVTAGLCTLPSNVRWGHLVGAGLLGGIGFTISIFITNLAFIGHAELINSSKIAIFIASLVAGNIGLLWLNFFCERSANIN